MEDTIQVHHENGVAHLLLNRPGDANALTRRMAIDMLTAVRDAERDPLIHVLAITGAGGFFCGGGDVKGMASAPDRSAFLGALADAAHEVMLAMAQSRLIVVSAVNGPAAGAGLGITLNSDYVIASEQAVFLSAYAGIGLTPDSGVSYLLPRAVGHQRSMELLVAGRKLDAVEAASWGMVNQVVSSDELGSTLKSVAESMASRAPQALGGTKRLVNLEMVDEYRAHLVQESSSISKMIARADTGELIDRFAARNTGT